MVEVEKGIDQLRRVDLGWPRVPALHWHCVHPLGLREALVERGGSAWYVGEELKGLDDRLAIDRGAAVGTLVNDALHNGGELAEVAKSSISQSRERRGFSRTKARLPSS